MNNLTQCIICDTMLVYRQPITGKTVLDDYLLGLLNEINEEPILPLDNQVSFKNDINFNEEITSVYVPIKNNVFFSHAIEHVNMHMNCTFYIGDDLYYTNVIEFYFHCMGTRVLWLIESIYNNYDAIVKHS